MDISTTKYGHLKYTVKLADFNTVNALTFDVPLDSLPPGVVIHSQTIKASTPLSGGGTTAQTARLKLNGVAIGAAAVSVANTTGLQDNTAAIGSLSAANPLVATITVATANLNTVTAGQVDFVINQSAMGV